MANSQTSSGGYWYYCIIQVSDIVKHIEPVHDTMDVFFYVRRVVDNENKESKCIHHGHIWKD